MKNIKQEIVNHVSAVYHLMPTGTDVMPMQIVQLLIQATTVIVILVITDTIIQAVLAQYVLRGLIVQVV